MICEYIIPFPGFWWVLYPFIYQYERCEPETFPGKVNGRQFCIVFNGNLWEPASWPLDVLEKEWVRRERKEQDSVMGFLWGELLLCSGPPASLFGELCVWGCFLLAPGWRTLGELWQVLSVGGHRIDPLSLSPAQSRPAPREERPPSCLGVCVLVYSFLLSHIYVCGAGEIIQCCFGGFFFQTQMLSPYMHHSTAFSFNWIMYLRASQVALWDLGYSFEELHGLP